MQIALNGVLHPAKTAVISVYDHGFLYGMGLFETFRTYGGSPFLLEEHLERLVRSCEELDIRYEPDEPGLRDLIRRLLHANGLEDAYFRLSISAGDQGLGLPGECYDQPAEIMYVKPLPPSLQPWEAGRGLQLLNARRNTPETETRLKSFHYMNSILGKRELARYPWAQGAEGLFLDDCGFISEGTASNLFFVHQGELYTPALDTCILPGITRNWVLHTALANGLPVEEGFFSWEMLLEADEIFLTNSIQGIMPVTRLYDPQGARIAVGGGTAGDITGRLWHMYAVACTEKRG